MARAPRSWRTTRMIALRAARGTEAIALTAVAALACAGVIHWSAALDHARTALGAALGALAALQIVAACLLVMRPRGSTAVAAIAALAGLAGWVWSATAAAALDGHSVSELPALATVALEIVALAAVVALRLRSLPRAWIGRHSTLVWGGAVAVACVALLITLLALTQGTAAHGVPGPTDDIPTHRH